MKVRWAIIVLLVVVSTAVLPNAEAQNVKVTPIGRLALRRASAMSSLFRGRQHARPD